MKQNKFKQKRKSILLSISKIFSANILAQGLNLITIAYLTSIYELSVIGELAVMISLISVLSTVSSFRLELLLLQQKSVRAIVTTFFYIAIISIITSISLYLGLIQFFTQIFDFVNYYGTYFLIALISHSLFLICQFYLIAQNRIFTLSFFIISKPLIFLTLTISLPDLYINNDLLETYLLSLILLGSQTILYILKPTIQCVKSLRRSFVCWGYLSIIKKIDVAVYGFPTIFVNQLSVHGPIFILNAYLGAEIVGLFTLLQRSIIAIVGVISASINKIFLQISSANWGHNRSNIDTHQKFFLLGLTIGIFLSVALITFKLLSGFQMLGGPWSELGSFTMYFIPFVIIGTAARSSTGFAAIGRSKMGLIFQVFNAAMLNCTFLIAQRYGNVELIFLIYSMCLFVISLIQVISMKLAIK